MTLGMTLAPAIADGLDADALWQDTRRDLAFLCAERSDAGFLAGLRVAPASRSGLTRCSTSLVMAVDSMLSERRRMTCFSGVFTDPQGH